MAYILDIAVILIFALAVFIGHKRGFIKAISSVAAVALAMALAALLQGPVSTLVYDKAVEPKLMASLEEIPAIDTAANEVLIQSYDTLPTMVKNMLTKAGITDAESLRAMLPTEEAPLEQEIARIARQVLLPLVESISSLVLFLVFQVGASWLMSLLNLAAKLPFIKRINTSLGFLAGALSGAMWVLFFVGILQLIAVFGLLDSLVSQEIIQETWLVSRLATISPISTSLNGLLGDVL